MNSEQLVQKLRADGIIRSDRIANVMKHTDRAKYIRILWGGSPYEDHPIPIGDGQTISAPHMHAQSLQLLEPFLQPGMRALDIGSGSGYLTACMGKLVAPNGLVVGIENRQSLVDLGMRNITDANQELISSRTVSIRLGNGWTGEGFFQPGDSPYDAIHVGAAAESVPDILVDALNAPGRMVIPVGEEGESQSFVVVNKAKDGSISQEELMSVMYVPLERHRHG